MILWVAFEALVSWLCARSALAATGLHDRILWSINCVLWIVVSGAQGFQWWRERKAQ